MEFTNQYNTKVYSCYVQPELYGLIEGYRRGRWLLLP